MEKLLSLKEVAAYLRVSVNTTYRLAERGQLPAFKISNRIWRVRAEDVNAWLHALKVTGQVGRRPTGRGFRKFSK
jgi:excisionase family DNA binding protein